MNSKKTGRVLEKNDIATGRIMKEQYMRGQESYFLGGKDTILQSHEGRPECVPFWLLLLAYSGRTLSHLKLRNR